MDAEKPGRKPSWKDPSDNVTPGHSSGSLGSWGVKCALGWGRTLYTCGGALALFLPPQETPTGIPGLQRTVGWEYEVKQLFSGKLARWASEHHPGKHRFVTV